MGNYIPSAAGEREELLKAVGVASIDALFEVVPQEMRIDKLDIPGGMSELEVDQKVSAMAARNKIFSSIFRGAGAYNHYIPAIVQSVVSREEFVTTYTPYQAEMNQGVLQSIFEYQTMICEITGMDASNASVYDGASAAAEAAAMCREKKRQRVLISATSNPMTIQTVQTYCDGADVEMIIVPAKNGLTDKEALASMLDNTVACLYVQNPNYFGLIEDAAALGEMVHEAKAKYILGVNPIAVNLKSAREYGADIAVGEGQPLGMPLSFGGPYLGFMASTSAMMRKLPGRIVGQTTDSEGKRGFVLTLQAREQHIRREKASSNVCSNQALCAMTASVYMSAMGPKGMRQVADLCYSKAHYAAEEISKIPGFGLRYQGDFFHEFVTEAPIDICELLGKLEEKDILGGYPMDGGLLWCVTEMNTKEQIDTLAAALKEVAGA